MTETTTEGESSEMTDEPKRIKQVIEFVMTERTA